MKNLDQTLFPGHCTRILCWVASILLAAAALMYVSCAVSPAVPDAPPSSARTAAPRASVPKDKALSPLSQDTQGFLAELRSHVRGGDWGWAAERADPSFLRAMEGRNRDSQFYTYLFSAGFLSTDSDAESRRFDALVLEKVRDMAWEESRIEGPVAVVRGRFLLSQGGSVPFSLRVLWKLDPPRILGVQP